MKFKILFMTFLAALNIGSQSNGQTKTDKLIGIPVPVTYGQPIKTQGATVYGYSSAAKAYTNNHVDMALLYNQAARLTDQAQQLVSRASDFSTLAQAENQNRAEVAGILAREQSAEIARILAREQLVLQTLEAQKAQASQFNLSDLLIATSETPTPVLEASIPGTPSKTFVFYVTQTDNGSVDISQTPPITPALVLAPAPAAQMRRPLQKLKPKPLPAQDQKIGEFSKAALERYKHFKTPVFRRK